MHVIRLDTLDDVCLETNGNYDSFLKYNIPCDVLGLPYLPLYALLRNQMVLPDGLYLGLSRLKNYQGLVAGICMLRRYERVSPQLVLDCFTRIRQNAKGDPCRVLKKGLSFFSRIDLDESQMDSFSSAVEGITTLGHTDETISGQVSITVLRSVPEKMLTSVPVPAPNPLPDKQYTRLTYQIQTISPLCVFSPFDAKSKSRNYLPGEVIMDFIRTRIGKYYDGEFESGDLRVSNAYTIMDNKRSIPAPDCMALNKLDKSVLQFRLAPKPEEMTDYAISHMSDQFVARPLEKTVLRYSPEEVRIFPLLPRNGLAAGDDQFSALGEGQVLQGYIKGSDPQIRAVYDMFSRNPIISLGSFIPEGYGEVLLQILSLHEPITALEHLAKEFDVFCISPVILYDEKGMYRFDAESLKQEVEKKLGAEGRLETVASYMQSGVCYRLDSRLPEDTAQEMCIQMGSSLRLRTKDRIPVDITPLKYCFIGNRKRVGYGEITAVPAHEGYYRNCEEIDPELFRLTYPVSIQDVQEATLFVRDILRAVLNQRVTLLALSDRKDHPIDKDASLEVLKTMRDRYDSTVSDEELLEMYQEVTKHDA